MNYPTNQMLNVSLHCWKTRNNMIHGSTHNAKQQLKRKWVREQISEIYVLPPKLANHFRSIFEIPLEHRLTMPLQATEYWPPNQSDTAQFQGPTMPT